MRVLLLRSIPRKSGHTQFLADLFASGMIEAGASVKDLDVAGLNIGSCLGCYCCWTRTPGSCIQRDAMSELLDEYLASDLLVIATPLYAYSVSSDLKKIMERFLPLMAPGIETTESGLDRNRMRFPDRGPSHCAAIIAGGLKHLGNAEGAVATLKLFMEGLGTQFCAALVRPESSMLHFSGSRPKTFKKIETAFKKAGYDFVKVRRISAECVEQASLPLVDSTERFNRYSQVYWDIAQQNNGESWNTIADLANSDVRILMYEMARCIDPLTAVDVTAGIQFIFTDNNRAYYLYIHSGTCIIEETIKEKPDLCLTCPSSIWAGIQMRVLDPVKMILEKKLTVQGDKELLKRLPRYFPAPSN